MEEKIYIFEAYINGRLFVTRKSDGRLMYRDIGPGWQDPKFLEAPDGATIYSLKR